MKCKNCDGTGKVNSSYRKDGVLVKSEAECRWCNGTGIQRKLL